MPNIMKIRQCFLKLQLKMLGMFFFETHCSYEKSNIHNNCNFCLLPKLFLLCYIGLLNYCGPCLMTFSSDSINIIVVALVI